MTKPLGEGKVRSHLIGSLKEEIGRSPVLSTSLRAALLSELGRWPKELPFVTQRGRSHRSIGRPKSSGFAHFLAVDRYRWATAEYLLSLDAHTGGGTFESNVSFALEWAKREFPRVKISRTKLVKHYTYLKNSNHPVKSIEILEEYIDELNAQYEEKLQDVRNSAFMAIDSEEDRLAINDEVRRVAEINRAISDGIRRADELFASLVISRYNEELLDPGRNQQHPDAYIEFSHALLRRLASLLLPAR